MGGCTLHALNTQASLHMSRWLRGIYGPGRLSSQRTVNNLEQPELATRSSQGRRRRTAEHQDEQQLWTSGAWSPNSTAHHTGGIRGTGTTCMVLCLPIASQSLAQRQVLQGSRMWHSVALHGTMGRLWKRHVLPTHSAHTPSGKIFM